MTNAKTGAGEPRVRRSEMKVTCSLTKRSAARFFFSATLFLFQCATMDSQEKNRSQSSPPKQEPPAVLKVTTRLVTVDVVARDHHGNAIRDLTADDFQITEQAGSHKDQQKIASFRLLDRAMAKGPDSERDALQLPAAGYTNLVTTKSLSAPPTTLLVDGMNTDATTQVQVRQKMVLLLAPAPTHVPLAGFRSRR